MPTRKRFTEDAFRREPWFKALCSALRSCESDEQMADFLRDIATLGELQDWSERLEVAKLLASGISYREVAAKTGASTTTVTRVAKFIENGSGGYRRLLHVSRHHRMMKAQDVLENTVDQIAPKPAAAQPASSALLQKFLDRAPARSASENDDRSQPSSDEGRQA